MSKPTAIAELDAEGDAIKREAYKNLKRGETAGGPDDKRIHEEVARRNNAQAAFEADFLEAQRLIAKLEDKLDADAEAFAAGGRKNWEYVGSLGYAISLLKRLTGEATD